MARESFPQLYLGLGPDWEDHSQITTNNAQSAQVQLPRLDANQLKLFQQLTRTVNPEVTTPSTQTPLPPPLAPITPSSEIVAGPSNPPTYWNNSRTTPDGSWDAAQVGHKYQPSPPVEENDYHSHRGRFRGSYRGRGRGRYGDRDREGHRDRFYDNARGPTAAHGRRSRSRSPPRSRYGGTSRRDIKPYSPPHRPSIVDQPAHDTEASSSHPGVDEFGREIRPSSDDDGSDAADDLKQRSASLPPAALSPTPAPDVEGTLVSGKHESSTIASPKIASATSGSDGLHQDMGKLGLESFDYSTFDPTSPASWETLQQAWTVTNGREPTQEELMMFVMELTVSMANQLPPSGPATSGPALQGNQRTGQQRWMGEPRGGPLRGGRGRGAFGTRGGRGGFAYGNSGGDDQAWWGHGGDGYAKDTDAIVLGEHTNSQNSFGWEQGAHEPAQAGLDEGDDEQMGSQGAMGRRIQDVGDSRASTQNDGSP